ncbi:MAG: pal [Ramlibacter sp.]|jgi:peptidoglycan-associated lipoprotein|nr:pal [Ramlibacter sp.]
MFKGVFAAFAVAVALVACSSVPLSDVPVEDKGASSVGQQPGGPGTGAQSGVAPVVTDTAAGSVAGPANVSRLIYFDYDSYEIKPEFQTLIESHARFMKANADRRLAIEGHTDERGGREYNLALGQRRAEAVRRALVLLGVADNRLEAVSFGKEKPADPGSDETAFAKNRRAELVYRR